MALNTCSK